MRLSADVANLTGWKAVAMAAVIITGLSFKVYNKMNRHRNSAPPVAEQTGHVNPALPPLQRGEDLVISEDSAVPTPVGFRWQPPKSLTVGDIPAEVHVAESADRSESVDLLLLKELPGSRQKFLEAMRDSYITSAQQNGAQLFNGQVPAIPVNVPERYRFTITFAPTAGYHNEMYFSVVFGSQQVYFFQAHTTSKQSADQLLSMFAEVKDKSPALGSTRSAVASTGSAAASPPAESPPSPASSVPAPSPVPDPAPVVAESTQPASAATTTATAKVVPDPVAKTKEPLQGDPDKWTAVQLPGAVYDCAIGMAGRLMILPLVDKDEAAVFDVVRRELVATIPVPQKSLIAAGANHLLVITPGDKTTTRYALSSFQADKKGKLNIDGEPLAVAMGAGSDGPALIQWKDPMKSGMCFGLIDPNSLEVRTISRPYEEPQPGRVRFYNGTSRTRLELRASLHGKVFTLRTGYGTSQMERLFIGRNLSVISESSGGSGHALPFPDGSVAGVGNGLATAALRLRTDLKSLPCFPSTDSRYYVALDDKQLAICDSRSNQPLYVVPGVAKELGNNFVYGCRNGNRQQPFGLMDDQRIHCVPQANLLVTICAGDNQLRVRDLPFNQIEAAMPPADENVLQLAGAVSRAVAAGAGRFLILHTPERGEAAVVDLVERKLLGAVPAADDALLAGGLDTLLVVSPLDKQVVRFSLPDLQQEKAGALQLNGTPMQLAMGSASAGPALLFWTPDGDEGIYSVLDAESFRVTQLSSSRARPREGLPIQTRDVGQVEVRASADGLAFGLWKPNSSPTGVEIVRLGATPENKHEHTTAGHVIPTVEGRVLTAVGNFAPDLKTSQNGRQLCLPTAHPHYMLVVTDEGGELRETLTGKEIASLPAIPELGKDFVRYSEFARRSSLRVANDERIHCLPAEDRIAVIAQADDRVVFMDVPFGLPDDLPSATEVFAAAAAAPATAAASATSPAADVASASPAVTEPDSPPAIVEPAASESPPKATPAPRPEPRRPPTRIWSDKTGKFKIDARLVSIEDGQVVLRKADGKLIKVPLEKLSDEDNTFVAELRKK